MMYPLIETREPDLFDIMENARKERAEKAKANGGSIKETVEDLKLDTINIINSLGLSFKDTLRIKNIAIDILQLHTCNAYGLPFRGIIFFNNKKEAQAFRFLFINPSGGIFSLLREADCSSVSSITNYEYSVNSRVGNVAKLRKYINQPLLGFMFNTITKEQKWINV